MNRLAKTALLAVAVFQRPRKHSAEYSRSRAAAGFLGVVFSSAERLA